MTASAHSPVPPPLTVVPPPPRPPALDDGGFSPLPAPRPPSTELGRSLPSSLHDGRQLAHSAPIVGSGSIVGSVTSASLLDYVRATLRFASSTAPRLFACPPPAKHARPPAWPLMPSRVLTRSHARATQAASVAVSGSFAYVTAYLSDSLVVVDISNPASPDIRGSVASSSLLDGVRVTLSCDPELRMHPRAALASAPSIVLAPAAPPLLMSLRTLIRSLSCAVHEGLWRRRERLVLLRGGV